MPKNRFSLEPMFIVRAIRESRGWTYFLGVHFPWYVLENYMNISLQHMTENYRDVIRFRYDVVLPRWCHKWNFLVSINDIADQAVTGGAEYSGSGLPTVIMTALSSKHRRPICSRVNIRFISSGKRVLNFHKWRSRSHVPVFVTNVSRSQQNL